MDLTEHDENLSQILKRAGTHLHRMKALLDAAKSIDSSPSSSKERDPGEEAHLSELLDLLHTETRQFENYLGKGEDSDDIGSIEPPPGEDEIFGS